MIDGKNGQLVTQIGRLPSLCVDAILLVAFDD